MRARVKNIQLGIRVRDMYFNPAMREAIGTIVNVTPLTYHNSIDNRDELCYYDGWNYLPEWLEFENEIIYKVFVQKLNRTVTVRLVDNNTVADIENGMQIKMSDVKYISEKMSNYEIPNS